MGFRKATLSTTIGLGLFALALVPILVLGYIGGRLVASNIESTLETSIQVQTGLAAKEAGWSRMAAETVLDSMALYPPEENAGLAAFLSKGGSRRTRLAFAARLDPSGKPSLLWPLEKAASVAEASQALSGAQRPVPDEPLWSGPYPDGQGGRMVLASRKGATATDLVATNALLLEEFLSVLRLSGSDWVAIWDSSGGLIAQSQPTPLELRGVVNTGGLAEKWGKLRTGGTRSYRIYTSPVPDSSWTASYYRDISFLSPLYANLILRLGGAALAAALLALLFGIGIRRSLTLPFGDILSKMKSVAKGHYDLRVGGDYPRELAEIARTFNLMAENVGIRDKELQESEKRYRSLFHENPVPALLIEPELGLIRGANPAAVEFYGYSAEELETISIQSISALSAAEILAESEGAKSEGRSHYSLKHRMKNGSVRDVEIYSNPISLGGKSYHYVLIFDVTARREAQEQLERALEEKVVLLKEVHHRVKNNLQIVASLLNLQIRYIKDPDDRELFKTSQNRVYSMSLTHELLYQASDLSSINMADYGQRLLSYLREAQQQADLRIISEFGHFELSLEKALPCGLILNELVTNAIKYARTSEGGKPIKVSLCLVSEGRNQLVHLEVVDHGPGLPPGMDPATSPTLGFSLISSLSRQLEGQSQWTTVDPGSAHPGTRASLSFPLSTHSADPLLARD